jgi:hypothetical protein
MSALQYHTFERFKRGWDPHQLPPDHLFPRDVGEGQVMDARGVRFTRGGSIAWRRDQFRIAKPSGVETKSVLEFKTDTYNQLLAFCDDGKGGAEAHLLTTDWSAATPAKWTYGYELFNDGVWSEIVTETDALAELETEGIADAVQAGEYLLIAPARGKALLRWDGATLTIVGIEAPPAAPVSGGTAAGSLAAGTYSYYYTYYDSETGYESMPSPILDVHVSSGGVCITVTGITDYGDGYSKRLYRAYTTDSGDDARGSDFKLVTTLPPGTGAGSTEDLTSWTEVDPGGLMTVAANSAGVAAMGEDDATYLYHDTGGAIVGDIEYRCAFTITAMDDGASVALIGTSNDIGDYADWGDVTPLAWLRRSGSTYSIVAGWANAYGRTIYGALATGTTYYLRLRKDLYTVEASLYDNADYSGTPLGTNSATVSPTRYNPVGGRYIYVIASWGTGTDEVSITVSDVVLSAATEYVDNVGEALLGEGIAFDHALPPRGDILCWHKDRVWMAGSEEGSRSYSGYDAEYYRNCLFYSALDEPFYYPGENMIVVGDDAPIVGLCSFGDVLVVLKANSVWSVRGWAGRGGAEGDLRVDLVTAQVGCVGAYAAAPGGTLWQAADGYYHWNGATVARVMEVPAGAPWDLPDPDTRVARIAFHDGRFYILQAGGWLEYEPAEGRWAYHEAEMEDADSDVCGFRAYAHGPAQGHVLGRMAWVGSGDMEITVLDAGSAFANGSTAGTTYSDLRAPVRITFAPLEAPPGYLIRPVEVWADCEYTDDAVKARRPKLFLNTDGSYSDTAGDNAWKDTPDAPTSGEVLGVPPSYEYLELAVTKYRTNVGRRWYVQIDGESAADFELHSLRVGYVLVRDRGEVE